MAMYEAIEPYYIQLLRIGWQDGGDTVGAVLGAFNLDNPFVQLILKDLAQRVKGIDDTTRERIQSVIGRTDLSVAEQTQLLLDMAVTESKTRAELIARTESASAAEQGNHLAWVASGQVGGKEWLVADDACPICSEFAGKVVGLDEEFADGIRHPPAHPACRCATAPILKD